MTDFNFVNSFSLPTLLIDWSTGELCACNEAVTSELILRENKIGKNWLSMGIWDSVALLAKEAEQLKHIDDKREIFTRIKRTNGNVSEFCINLSLICLDGINFLLCTLQSLDKLNNLPAKTGTLITRSQEDVLYTVLFAAEQFFKGSLLKNAIRTFLDKVGKVTKVDCVYIFPVNGPDIIGIDQGQRLEWSREGDHVGIQGFTLGFFLPRLLNQLENQKIVYGTRGTFDKDQQTRLDAYSIASMAVIPLIVNNDLWGIIGFEHQNRAEEWKEKNLEPLRGCANILSAAIQNEQNRKLLRDSEQQYRAVIEDQTELICRWNKIGVITFCNIAFMKYFDLSDSSDAEGQNIEAFFIPGDGINIHQLTQKLSEKVPSTTVSFKLKLSSGVKWMQTTIRALFEQTTISGYQSVSRDLTDLITAEEAARESESKYGLLFNTMMDGFLLISVKDDCDTQKHLYCLEANQALLNYIGLPPEENILNRPISELIPELGQEWIQTICDVYKSKNAKRFEGRLWDGHFEAIIYPTSNKQIAVILSDRTVRKQAEEEIAESNKKMSLLLDILSFRNKQVTLVNKLAESLMSCRSLDEAYLIVEQYCIQIFEHYKGALYIQEENREYLSVVACWGGQIESYVNPEKCWALRRGQIHVYPGDEIPKIQCKHFDEAIDHDNNFFSICIPMNAQGIFRGMFTVYSGSAIIEDLFEEITELAKTVSEQISMCLANIKLRESLLNLSVKDPLTQLFNRRYMEESLLRELSSAHRHNANVSAVMTDVDHFKGFNDKFGHDAGDYVLKEFANLIRHYIRSEDIPCRFGGEEFFLILPGADIEIANQRAENIRAKLADLNLVFNGQNLGTVTASFGISCFSENCKESETLIKNADRALYSSKKNGRNKVTIYKAGME